MSSKLVTVQPSLYGFIDAEGRGFAGGDLSAISNERFAYVKFPQIPSSTAKLYITLSNSSWSASGNVVGVGISKVLSNWDMSMTWQSQPVIGSGIGTVSRNVAMLPYTESINIEPNQYGYMLNSISDTGVVSCTSYLEYTEYTPEINNFTIAGDSVDSDIVATFTLVDVDSYVFQVIYDNNVVYTSNGTSETTKTIPSNVLHYAGQYTFKIIASKNGVNVEESITKTLIAPEPTIDNATLSSAEVERGTNIVTTVTGTNIDGYTVNILNTGNTVIASNVGTTFSTANYPAGKYKAQIVAYHTNGYYTTYDTDTIAFETTEYTPVIESSSLSSTNVEKGSSITSTATGTRVSGHTVNILDSNSNLVASNVGTTFSTASLGAGNYKAQIVAYYKNNSYTSYATTTIDFSVFVYKAEITSVWPNSTRELRKSNIQLGFSAKNFTSYSISAIQGNVTKYTKSGTNTSNIDEVVSKTFDMVNSLFDQGEASITVSVTNARSSYSTDDSMTVKFTVIDNPNTPTLTYDQDYSTPKPTIYCACSSAYVSYIIAIDDIEGSEIFGNISQYYFETALENNAYHTFKLKVKNTYGLWSEWATASFHVSYAELNTPEFSVYTDVDNGCICVAMESSDEENFSYNSVLRLENGTWVEIGKNLERICTFYDNSCASNKEYSYKVRAYDIFGGYKDTSSTTCKIDFTGTILSVPWTNQKLKLEYFNSEDDVTKNIANNVSDTYVEVCGLSLPKLQKGTLKGRSLQLNVAFKTKAAYDEFINFIGNDTLLFRDGKGIKMYCHITTSNEKDYLRYYKCVTANIKEIYYKEGDFIEIPDKPFTWNVEEY